MLVVLIRDEKPQPSGRPRFDKRSIFAGLIICALLCCSSCLYIYVYEARHPAIPGERDLGEGILVMTSLLAAGIAFLGGVMSIVLELVYFVWLDGDLVVALSQAQRQDNALLQSRVIEASVLTVPQLDTPRLFCLRM